MNRKNKIIVSIVGITIVLLALLGLTYAYYLTRIQGNTNTTSISITTADLKLEYSEGEDSNISLTGLMPGVDIPAKTFTVTNSGNSKVDDYVVAIIDVTNTLTRTDDLTYTLTCVQKNESGVVTGTCKGVDTDPDTEYPTQNSMIVTNSIEAGYVHEYSLKLTYVNLTDTDQSIDMGSTIKGKVQIYGLADTIDLTGTVTGASEGDYVQINSEQMTSQIVDGTYTLVGIEPGVHSLKIMNKEGVKQKEQYIKINKGDEVSVTTGEIELEDESTVNGPIITIVETSRTSTIDINKTTGDYTPNNKILDYNPFNTGTLAYKIVDNAINSTDFGTEAEGYAVYRLNPTTTPAANSSNSDEASLSQTEDDLTESTGINSYYFRGNVKNNYVNFAGKCWRIVRIEGDGSIRLILDDSNTVCNDSETNDINEDEKYYTRDWHINSIDLGDNVYDFGTDNNDIAYNKLETYADYIKDSLMDWFKKNLDKEETNSLSVDYKIHLKSNVEQCIDNIPYDKEGNEITNMEAYINSFWNEEEQFYDDLFVSYDKHKWYNTMPVKPTLKCSSTLEPSYIYALTADEVFLAGGEIDGPDEGLDYGRYYLVEEDDNNYAYWIFSPSYFDIDLVFYMYYIEGEGWLTYDLINADSTDFRPVISLKNSSIWSKGNGTQTSPYEIILK